MVFTVAMEELSDAGLIVCSVRPAIHGLIR